MTLDISKPSSPGGMRAINNNTGDTLHQHTDIYDRRGLYYTHDARRDTQVRVHASRTVLQSGCSLVLLLFRPTDADTHTHTHRAKFAYQICTDRSQRPSLGVVVTRPAVVSVTRCKSETSASRSRNSFRLHHFRLAQIILCCLISNVEVTCVEQDKERYHGKVSSF